MRRSLTGTKGIYLNSCPNCGGAIDERRLRKGLPCSKCLPKVKDVSRKNLQKALMRHGTLGAMAEIWELESRAEELAKLFSKLVGKPWGAQRSWIRRVIRGDSFSIMAPTGTGKTVFGLVASIFFACRKGQSKHRALILVPTTTLVREFTERLEKFVSKSGCQLRVLGYHGKVKKREEVLRDVIEGNFDILLATIAFARAYADQLSRHGFALIFVDDVDAVLKSNRSVRAVLRVAGLSEEDIRTGEELLAVQRKIAERRNSGENVSELYERRDSLKKRVEEIKANVSQLIVSSATGRARGSASRLFRALLGFEVGGGSDVGLRNIVDAYLFADDPLQEAVSLVSKLGDGTLVFVSKELGTEKADELTELLKKKGVRAEAYHSKSAAPRKLEDFKKGNIEVLVGIADYYGLLVRGLDLPQRIKHVVFVGVPKIVLRVGAERPSVINLTRLLSILTKSSRPEIVEEARRKLAELRRVLRRFSPAYLQSITEKIERGEADDSPVYKIIVKARDFVNEVMKREEVWEELSKRGDISIAEVNGRKYIRIADVATYIQGSGRSSRLYAGGLTKGLSVVLVDDRLVFNDLVTRLRRLTSTKWSSLSELELDVILREISEERRRMKERKKNVDLMKSVLLVVESPNKARTIASFFGRPAVRIMQNGLRIYEVTLPNHLLMIAASGGHVYDLTLGMDTTKLPKPYSRYENVFGVLVGNRSRAFVPVFATRKRCLSCGYRFASESPVCPMCGSKKIEDSAQIIEDLRRAAWEVDEVLIGTDPDTEGEKIGWDLFLALSPYSQKIRRIEFHEVTREEILSSLASPREFNERLVEAQLVRRIEDRWIGFTLSPLLWCIFWPRYCSQSRLSPRETKLCERKFNYNLSAGRVQTPVMGWLVKREEERKPVDLYLIDADSEPLIALREDAIEERVARFLRRAWEKRKGVKVRISLVSTKIEEASPPPPYTTDTLIADANRYLRMGAAEAMRLAQDLFTWGLITYHRTDSTRVSEKGLEIAKMWLSEKFGERHGELMELRRWGEEGAHEAIRPVRPLDAETLMSYVEEGLIELPEVTNRHLELYDMIFRRFMASQMKKVRVVKGTYQIEVVGQEGSVTITEERVVEVGDPSSENASASGFTLVWKFGPKPRPLRVGEVEASVKKKRIRKLPLMTQADIVEQMKSRGIGRPSTYSQILETLFKRGYVIAPKKRREYVVPTKMGKMSLMFLTKELEKKEMRSIEFVGKHLRIVPALVTEERTRDLERAMDEVERGSKYWQAVVKELYREIRGLSRPIRLFLSRNDVGAGGGELLECLREARGVFGEENQEEQR
ncbi:MAG: reverse gyrase [Acidilobaceae archaeon]|nr:reverse gyrase [Acidilobaceae archaeon]